MIKLTNLLSSAINKKLPPILPDDNDETDITLDEDVISREFDFMNLKCEPLQVLMPPQFSLKLAYPGQMIKIIDLIYMTLGYYSKVTGKKK